ncbi:hypothetical protein A8F94_22560 [Bacillus sp. FJAT-27225]|uniref:hypothetical protein n=1 Tax=Bacillus sp. FJAT-27225 TaxID=1743144 RepID=UPI00080C2D3F|nr:hypothetical protein [Bacillus sp. FJAT-27225]OCA81648.1 hypothetical protein A8F94_22560 [Bacillus sp. FJAT-27225]
MPKKSDQKTESVDKDKIVQLPEKGNKNDQGEELSRMLAAVLEYLSDETVEVIDINYLFDNTEGLEAWWNDYQENNRKKIEAEIRESLSKLSLEDLQKIRGQIKENQTKG